MFSPVHVSPRNSAVPATKQGIPAAEHASFTTVFQMQSPHANACTLHRNATQYDMLSCTAPHQEIQMTQSQYLADEQRCSGQYLAVACGSSLAGGGSGCSHRRGCMVGNVRGGLLGALTEWICTAIEGKVTWGEMSRFVQGKIPCTPLPLCKRQWTGRIGTVPS